MTNIENSKNHKKVIRSSNIQTSTTTERIKLILVGIYFKKFLDPDADHFGHWTTPHPSKKFVRIRAVERLIFLIALIARLIILIAR